MTTSEIQSELKVVSDRISTTISSLSEDQLAVGIGSGMPIESRWNAGQHLAHLYLSSQPVNKAMAIPKEILEQKFGTRNRDEYSHDDLLNLYNQKLAQGGVKAPVQFSPERIHPNSLTEYLDKYKEEIAAHIRHMNTWTGEELSKYVLPHPAIGTITMREMMLFTVIHNQHHLKAIEGVK